MDRPTNLTKLSGLEADQAAGQWSRFVNRRNQNRPLRRLLNPWRFYGVPPIAVIVMGDKKKKTGSPSWTRLIMITRVLIGSANGYSEEGKVWAWVSMGRSCLLSGGRNAGLHCL